MRCNGLAFKRLQKVAYPLDRAEVNTVRAAAPQFLPHQFDDIVHSGRQKLTHLPALRTAKENIEQIRARLVLDTKDGRLGCDLASADRFALPRVQRDFDLSFAAIRLFAEA